MHMPKAEWSAIGICILLRPYFYAWTKLSGKGVYFHSNMATPLSSSQVDDYHDWIPVTWIHRCCEPNCCINILFLNRNSLIDTSAAVCLRDSEEISNGPRTHRERIHQVVIRDNICNELFTENRCFNGLKFSTWQSPKVFESTWIVCPHDMIKISKPSPPLHPHLKNYQCQIPLHPIVSFDFIVSPTQLVSFYRF